MKIKFINYGICIICCLMLVSCFDNEIYFDLTNQTICSCNKQRIINLYIDGSNSTNFYHWILKPNKKGTNSISIRTENNNYVIENMWNEDVSKEFRLQPNTEYEIRNNTFGDAAGGKLTIKTNNKGVVIYADKTSCQ
ncbi:MAG: hypothetical protein Q8861_12760 [Bacteroidota bacterium]|nr:hypothetical protein [Bacteroidota bacterium]